MQIFPANSPKSPLEKGDFRHWIFVPPFSKGGLGEFVSFRVIEKIDYITAWGYYFLVDNFL
jgi:hypothetical protein